MRKWLIGWSVAGLVAPFLYLSIYFVTGYQLGEGIFVFWPASMGLMVVENRPPVATVVLVWLLVIGLNPLLYGIVGLLLWPLTLTKSKEL
jgi:hypothetical protein